MNLNKFALKNSKGFTILELLVSTTIMMILAAVLFSVANKQESISLLQRETYTLAQNIRNIEQMAMSAQAVNCSGSETKIFGVHFEQSGSQWENSYILFGDCDSNRQRNVGDVDVQEIKLRKDVQFDSLSFSPINTFLDIVFVPPHPTVYFNASVLIQEAVITLSLKNDPAQQKKVKVNTVGKIEIE